MKNNHHTIKPETEPNYYNKNPTINYIHPQGGNDTFALGKKFKHYSKNVQHKPSTVLRAC